MKIFFYHTKADFPSQKSYEWIGGDSSKVFFSHAEEFSVSQIGSSLPLNFREEPIYLMPEHWEGRQEQALLTLLEEKYVDKIWKKEKNLKEKPLKEEIAKGWNEELAKFYDEDVQIVSVLIAEQKKEHVTEDEQPMEKKATPYEFFWHELTKIKLFFSFLDDPMKLGVMVSVVVFVFIMGIKHASVEHHSNKITTIKEALEQNNLKYIEETLATEWKKENARDIDNPALVYQNEIKIAESYQQTYLDEKIQTTISPEIKEDRDVPIVVSQKCYIVKSGDFPGGIAEKFGTTQKKIKEMSIQKKNGKEGIYFYNEGLEKYSFISELDDIKNFKSGQLKIGWQLVISKAIRNLEQLQPCYFGSSP